MISVTAAGKNISRIDGSTRRIGDRFAVTNEGATSDVPVGVAGTAGQRPPPADSVAAIDFDGDPVGPERAR